MAPAAKHREGLIAASVTLFQRQGYAATGLAEILASSGAPRGSLYHYFPDGKEAIAEAALQLASAGTEKRIRDAAARLPEPRAFAHAYGQALANMLLESDFTRGCPVATVALEVAPGSARLTAAIRDTLGAWSTAIADMLRTAGIESSRAAELGDLMMAAFQGSMILARVRQSTVPVMQTAEEMARLFDHELLATRKVS